MPDHKTRSGAFNCIFAPDPAAVDKWCTDVERSVVLMKSDQTANLYWPGLVLWHASMMRSQASWMRVMFGSPKM